MKRNYPLTQPSSPHPLTLDPVLYICVRVFANICVCFLMYVILYIHIIGCFSIRKLTVMLIREKKNSWL